MALFHMLTDWESSKKPEIIVASIDHGLRSESKSEVEFVKKVCEMKKKTRHFLNINELKSTDIKKIINQSHILKKEYGKRKLKEKKILAMIFEKPSTRTRVSFEVGMKQLDGDVVILDQADSQLGGFSQVYKTFESSQLAFA